MRGKMAVNTVKIVVVFKDPNTRLFKMKVSMNIYGKQAEVLARELGLACSCKTAKLDMTASFCFRDCEGHTVVTAEFTSTTPEPADCNGNEEREADFLKAERRFDAAREARGY